MVDKSNPLPIWIRKSLQGLTYWIGHKRSLYSGYPLRESALVAELCALISSNLDDGMIMECEVMYSEVARGQELPQAVSERARADLVIFERATNKFNRKVPKFIIEIKRASVPAAEIDRDLRRLASISMVLPTCRVMLFVIAESGRPKRFC
jgi:hypothetical protein